ncbi:DinB family protein [Pedobacter sp. ASV28]|uniref:DinB family protein n=1 Tax=Pedobacter sp. ASV28 TaxID=2795123 RepID=UPI0018EAA69E|nr:DinB family protein [Pedobacter sp. ASV28]
METKTEITESLNDVFSGLEKAIKRFDAESFNHKSTKDTWSPAQVAQHLVLAGADFDKVLSGNTKFTDGPADARVIPLKEILLNFELKMKAPAFIEPVDKNYNQRELLQQLDHIGKVVAKLISDLDLTETCLDFELPGFGHITRLEAIYFLIYHTQRHTYQLNKMSS